MSYTKCDMLSMIDKCHYELNFICRIYIPSVKFLKDFFLKYSEYVWCMWLLDFCDLLDNSIYTWGDISFWIGGDEDSSSMTEVHSNHLQRLNSGLPEGWEARLVAEQGRIYYLKWVLHNTKKWKLYISQIIKLYLKPKLTWALVSIFV